MTAFRSASPVSNEDPMNLPVQALEPAIAYYEDVLGFAVVSRDVDRTTLARDEARLGLVVDAKHRPSEAGSIAFGITDIDALHAELTAKGANPGAFRLDDWGGTRFRVFFVREDRDGYCYCFHSPA